MFSILSFEVSFQISLIGRWRFIRLIKQLITKRLWVMVDVSFSFSGHLLNHCTCAVLFSLFGFSSFSASLINSCAFAKTSRNPLQRLNNVRPNYRVDPNIFFDDIHICVLLVWPSDPQYLLLSHHHPG
jgi:hypothetical protein